MHEPLFEESRIGVKPRVFEVSGLLLYEPVLLGKCHLQSAAMCVCACVGKSRKIHREAGKEPLRNPLGTPYSLEFLGVDLANYFSMKSFNS